MSTRREPRRVGRPLILFALAALIAGCSGAASTPSPDRGDEPTGSPNRPGASGDLVLPSFPGETATPPVEAGAQIRIVNVWGAPDGPGPKALLRIRNEAEAILEVAAGEVSEFVDIPASMGDRVASIELIREDADASESWNNISIAKGDVVTLIVHGEDRQGTVELAWRHIWEAGEPQYGAPWPEVPSEKATLLVYPGSMVAFTGRIGMNMATADGDCLVDAPGEMEQEPGHSIGGNAPEYFVLDPGTTEIVATRAPGDGCQFESQAEPALIEAAPGGRYGLLPWAPEPEGLELLVVDMS